MLFKNKKIKEYIAIGFWDTGNKESTYIHPRLIAGHAWTADEKRIILNYLRSGVRINDQMGYSWCRLDPSIPHVKMGNAEITDGHWIWPEGLSVYVDIFDVELPREFTEHALRAKFDKKRAKKRIKYLDDWNKWRFDFDYWEKWCAVRMQQG